MLPKMKHWDIALGTGGTLATITLGGVNVALATVSGLLTIFILAVRARREWRNRNKPPTET